MTHLNQIREHLTEGKSITPLEALNKYGCFRLAARISDLRNEGLDIKTELIQKGKMKYAKYVLKNS